jgi:predicted nucleotidyltransferase
MISNQDRRILGEFSYEIRKRFSNAKIWAFGSRSRGTSDWDSDFDICIVLDHVDGEIDGWIRDVAWEVGFENERLITTIVLDSEQFETGPMSESTLVENILQDGVAA